MPRVINKLYLPKYKAKDFTDLVKAKMAIKDLTQEDMADELNISRQAFGQKLKKMSYSFTDVITIIRVLRPSDEEILKVMR